MLNEAVVAVVAVVADIRSAAAPFHVEAHPIRVDHVEDRPILVLHHAAATLRHRAAARTARLHRRAATPHRAAAVHIVRLLQVILIIILLRETIVDTVPLVVAQPPHAALPLRPHIVAPQQTA